MGFNLSQDEQINLAFKIHKEIQQIDNKILLDALKFSIEEQQEG